MPDLHQLVTQGRAHFQSGRTLDPAYRRAQLRRLYDTVRNNLPLIEAALKADLNKSPYESYMTEVSIVLEELRYLARHLSRWSRPRRLRPSLGQIPASVRLYSEPYGLVLIMSPWNYPIQLTLVPVACALAAGNTVIVKPSAYSPQSSAALRQIIESSLDPGLVQVVEGGRAENQGLLAERFDYIFFTGSPQVGHLVMEAASRHLTPITLELGGKSPVIVDETADLALAARRLAFGKLSNAGQTCVAPDHIYVQRSVRDAFLHELQNALAAIRQDEGYYRDKYPRIVNRRHYERLCSYLEGQKILSGGHCDPERLQIEPTILDEPAPDSPVMQEEIFGPIFPLLTYDDLDELILRQQVLEKPLALYHFSRDAAKISKVQRLLSAGGSSVNDCLLHMISVHAPFGGVGNSGMGSYHGKYGFACFSHQKTVLKKPKIFDNSLRYHPFSPGKFKLLKWLLH